MNDNLNEKGEKIQLLSRDLDANSDMSLKYRIFNFYYSTLRKKSVGLILLTFFMIFETIELVSYAFIDIFRPFWCVNKKAYDLIQLITGSTRLTPLMKYLTFDQYFIVFIILNCFVFINFLLIAMTLTFNRTESKLYSITVAITSYITSNACAFFLVPMSELMLLVIKCNSNHQVDIVKNSIKCFNGLHIVYVFLAIVMMLCFLCLIVLNSIFNFNPFNANKQTAILNPQANTLLVIFKIILVILYIALDNDWIFIVIMVLGSLLNLKTSFESPTYNSFFLQCMVSIRNFSVFWTFIVLLICRMLSGSNFNGMIYFLAIGYPFICIVASLYYSNLLQEFCEGKSNFKNETEFLMRANFLKVLIDDYIEKNMSVRTGTNTFNSLKQKEILLRGQIEIHEETCTNEECPLKKFLENQGNFQVQRTSLLHYMNILYSEAIKKFPDSQLILLNYVEFNYEKKYNLNTAKMYLEKLERFKNPLTEDYIIFFIKKSVSMIKNNFGEDEMIRIEDTPEHKFKRFKLLIDASTKMYGEFWGNLATNLTSSLNLNKLFYVGTRLNDYLHELQILWEEFKTFRIDSDQQSILQLYSKFLKEIIQNKVKSDEVDKKIKEEINYKVKKGQNDKIDINNVDALLENQDYIFYCRSNDMGKCHFVQCSNSIISLIGYTKQEIIGKRIEMLMPLLCQADHGKMLGKRLKKLRAMMTENAIETIKSRAKRQFLLLPKNKAGYLMPVITRYTIYNDDDFSNTFIIKVLMEGKDPKILYSYYVLTRNDFTVDSITSSSINLGLSMELLKKHMISLDKLILNPDEEFINFSEQYVEYLDEPKLVTWVFPDYLNKKKSSNNLQVNNTATEIDYNQIMEESRKKKMNLQIYPLRYKENEILGYCFQFFDLDNQDKIEYDENGFSEFQKKLMIFDIKKLNYTRADIVAVKNIVEEIKTEETEKKTIKEKTEETNRSNESGEKKETKTNEKSEKKKKDESDSKESFVEIFNPLTKEAIQDFQIKPSDDIRKFIKILPFFGKEILLKKKTPTKQEFSAGYGIEPNINVSLDDFLKKIEYNHLLDKRQIEKEKNEKFNIAQGNNNTDFNYLSSSTSSLNNLFSETSMLIIKISAISYFVILGILLIIEFIVSFNKISNLNNRVYYSDIAYKILTDLMYSKYFITEIVCAQNSSYKIYDLHFSTNADYIESMRLELQVYRKRLSDNIGLFSNASVSFGKDYITLTDNSMINIMTLTNNIPTYESQPFWTGITRIATSIFFISTITVEVNTITMEERNTYEVMMNLLNDYYISWKKVVYILVHGILNDTNISDVTIAVFVLSFILTFFFGFFSFKAITKFLNDGTRPVDLIMTIKKSRFEDLKLSCETFMNKLLNKFLGEEDDVDDEGNENQTNYSSSADDIVISKFKQKNEYNQSIKSNQLYLTIFIGILICITLFQGYFIFKFLYSKYALVTIENFSDINNITRYNENHLILSYNIIKSYFLDSSIPILNNEDTKTVAINTYESLTDSFEELERITYLKMEHLSGSYINFFYEMINRNITHINTGDYTDDDFLQTMIFGFKNIILRYFSLVRTSSKFYFNNIMTIDFGSNKDYGEAANILRYVIRPWFVSLLDKLDGYFESKIDNIKVIITFTFILFLVFAIVLYFLIWQKIEYKMEKYLQSSIDLINLIPEEIKYQILVKLNEEEQRENKN